MFNFSKIKKHYHHPAVLVRRLAISNFKLRYQGSFLGYLWSLLKPLAIFAVLYIVFVYFLKFGRELEHFGLYLLLGVVFWSFFLETTSSSLKTIVDHGDLIRRVNFPKYTLPLAAAVSAVINLGLNLVVVGFFIIVFGDLPSLASLAWLPLVLLELFLVSLAAGLFLASVYVRFRDINHIWEVASQVLFYATPIIYPLSLVGERASQWLLVNPLAQTIQDGRYLLVTKQTPTIGSVFGQPGIRLLVILATLGLLLLAGLYFKQQSGKFAEMI